MIEYEHILIDFKDEKDVEVLSLKISNTYSKSLEGSCRSISILKISELLAKAKEKGFCFRLTENQLIAEEPTTTLQRWAEREKEKEMMCLADYRKETQVLQPNDVLKPYCYNLSLQDKNHNSHLTVVWFDNAPSMDSSLKEIIEKYVKSISYHDYARVIDWEDF